MRGLLDALPNCWSPRAPVSTAAAGVLPVATRGGGGGDPTKKTSRTSHEEPTIHHQASKAGMDNITANEVAGLGVGALLLAAALATPKVDAFIARAQRRQLHLCLECGGVTRIPCARCNARGTLHEGLFGRSPPVSCSACRGKGNFPCPCCCGNHRNNTTSTSSSSLVRCEWRFLLFLWHPVKMFHTSCYPCIYASCQFNIHFREPE